LKKYKYEPVISVIKIVPVIGALTTSEKYPSFSIALDLNYNFLF